METGKQIDKFKKWAESNEILFIEGFVNFDTPFTVEFTGSQEGSFTDFKEVANKLNIGIVFYIYKKFDVKILDVYEKEVYNSYSESTKAICSGYMNHLNSIRNSMDEYLLFKAFMIQDGVIYIYKIQSEFYSSYYGIESKVNDLENEARLEYAKSLI